MIVADGAKTAARFRVSLTALLPKQARSRWLEHGALPCCAGDDVEAESASLRVDRPVYPRRVELTPGGRAVASDFGHASKKIGGDGVEPACAMAMRTITDHRFRRERGGYREAMIMRSFPPSG